MTIYHNSEGSIIISDIVDGYLFERVYQGYTLREAKKLFTQAKREITYYQKISLPYYGI